MKNRWIALIVIMLGAGGCSGITVSQDYDPAMDVGEKRTYTWKSPSQEKTGDPRVDNPLRDKRTREAVERVLAQKGFTKQGDPPPALLIDYQYLLRRRIESGGTRGSVGFGIGSYGRHGGIAIGTGNDVREYDEGAMVIDILDATSNSLLWRGTGSQRYREYDDPEKTTQGINTMVEKILDPFPPQT